MNSKPQKKCLYCDNLATCFGQYEEGPEGYACDTCCLHGNEDGACVPVAATHEMPTGGEA